MGRALATPFKLAAGLFIALLPLAGFVRFSARMPNGQTLTDGSDTKAQTPRLQMVAAALSQIRAAQRNEAELHACQWLADNYAYFVACFDGAL